MEKIIWEKPKLIVLTRNKPQEAVLFTCKGGSIDGSSTGTNTKCELKFLDVCGICHATGGPSAAAARVARRRERLSAAP